MSSGRLPQLGLIPRRVAIEPKPGEVLFAESVWRPGGQRLRACGSIPCNDGEKLPALLERLVRTPWLRGAELSLAVRHPDMNLQRLELPPLSSRDARSVADRRVGELAEDSPEPVNRACVIAKDRGRERGKDKDEAKNKGEGKRGRTTWLVTCPEEFAAFVEKRWAKQGLAPSHFGCSQLALGWITRALPEQQEGTLRAFLDISNDHAVCVVADREGWVFGREIPIKIARVTRSTDGADPAERLATELRRTFHYVDAECDAGTVESLVLSGSRERLDELATQLGAQLALDVKLLGDAISDGPAAGAEPALANVIGLALESRIGSPNLLSRETRRRVSHRKTTRMLIAAAIVPALALAIGVGRTAWLTSSLDARRVLLEAGWDDGTDYREQAEAAAVAVEAIEAVTRAHQAISRPQPSWSSAFRSLGVLLPPDAFLTAIEAAETDGDWPTAMRLEFRGSDLANATRAGSSFAETLDESPLWAVQRVEREPAPRRRSPLLRESNIVQTHYRFEALVAPVRAVETAGATRPRRELPLGSAKEGGHHG